MAASTAGAAPAAKPPAPPALPPPLPASAGASADSLALKKMKTANEQCKHKNRLQEFAQRIHQKLPIYHAEPEGQQHQLKFKCTVQVGSERFSSAHSYSRLKEAEQEAARVAYEILVKREEGSDVTDMFGLIDQDVVFCKSILHEFAVKKKATQPSYSVVNPEGLGPMTLFVASVLFDGNTYTGEAAKSKKDAEQKAARAAVKSMLATKDTCMLQIIRSKKKLITAITSSGYNKERGAVSQEAHGTPTNTLPPVSTINFTPPVTYEAYGTPQFAYTAYGFSPGTSMQLPSQVQVLNVSEPLQRGPTHIVPISQAGSSFPVAFQGPNIIPASTHIVPPASQAGSASPITVQGPKIIPALDPSANPSAQSVSGSKKRKKNRIRGPEATEERAAE